MDDFDSEKEPLNEESGSWLDRMHAFLEWRVVVPEFDNPFGTPMSDSVLMEFATRKESLLKHVELKGNVDGEEIITLKNISRDVDVITNHPAVIMMKKGDIRNYIKNSGLQKIIEDNLNQAQSKYLAELKRRKIKLPPKPA